MKLKDENGNVVVELTSSKAYQTAVISAPEMAIGSSYSLYCDEVKLCDLTLTDTITQVNSDGSAATGGMSGFGNGRPGAENRPQGGGQPGGGMPGNMTPPAGMP